MEDVQFHEEPEYVKRSVAPGPKPSFITGIVIATGLAKDEKGAQPVLIGVLIAVLALTAFVIWRVIDEPEPELGAPLTVPAVP